MASLRFFLFLIVLVSARAQNDDTGTSTSTSTPISSSSTTSTTTTKTTAPTTQSPTTEAPSPPAKVPTWTVKSSNSTCLLLRGNFTFAVTSTAASGNTVSSKVDIPNTAKATGSCGPFLNSLVLTWGQSNLTFLFIKKPVYDAGVDTGNGTYSLTSIFGRLSVENSNDTTTPGSPGSSFYISVREPGFMTTPLHNSYSCESYQSLAADKTGSVYLEMTGVQVEAFHDGLTTDFNPNQPCTKDTLSSVLPIVGYVVLGVVIGSAVGYLAWKKLSRAGYMEV